MQIRVLLFGPEARLIDRRELYVSIERQPVTCADLRASLVAIEPRLIPALRSARFAVNCEFADDRRQLRATDEVALIGAVSGG
jgi:molybdopterin converting factor small subunit